MLIPRALLSDKLPHTAFRETWKEQTFNKEALKAIEAFKQWEGQRPYLIFQLNNSKASHFVNFEKLENIPTGFKIQQAKEDFSHVF